VNQIKQINKTKLLVTILRMVIGWHLLYEGLSKILEPGWTAHQFLSNTTGFLSGFYHFLASSPGLIKTVDILNMYGLTLIGLALFIGVFVRYAALGGFFLLALYYFAYPPFGPSLFAGSGFHLYIVDKNFIEAIILLLFVFFRDTGYGIDALREFIKNKSIDVAGQVPATTEIHARREILKNLAAFPILGFMGWGAIGNQKKHGIDVMSGATIQINQASLSELKGVLPKGKLGKYEMSRLVLGGNLIGGWAHSRDLIYMSSLFKAYNSEKKIFETLRLAEDAGIDTINIGYVSNPLMAKYKRLTGSKIKVISQVAPNMKNGDYFEQINGSIDNGADILQVQGNWCDWLVRDNNLEVIDAMLSRIRGQGYFAGLGAHTVDALIACEEQGIIPDYYMQTMHHDNYWSAHPVENRVPFEVDGKRHLDHNRFHDNIFCLFPDKTVEFVKRVDIPVMGFKVLAAGAIKPEDGFKWAFENGADFICVGMFDFQIVNDVNITIDILKNLEKRDRQWHA
jgi:uncharacterized membrane protein YphA (DoxX/SURF4 family)